MYTVRGLTDGPHASDSGDEEEPAAHAAADSVPGSSDNARPEPRAVPGHAHAAPARPHLRTRLRQVSSIDSAAPLHSLFRCL